MLSTQIDVFTLGATLALCVFSGCNAAPLTYGAQGNPPLVQLAPRGNGGIMPVLPVAGFRWHCPSVQEAIQSSQISEEQLKNRALFYFRLGKNPSEIQQLRQIATQHQKYRIIDLFPADFQDIVYGACGKHEGVMILSEAMATLASGEVWVVARPDENPLRLADGDSVYWLKELNTMRAEKKVAVLYQIDPSTGSKRRQMAIY